MGILAGKVAVVTGGTGSLGRTVARRFLQEGAAVHVPYLDQAAAAQFKTEFAAWPQAVLRQADLTDESAVEALFDDALARTGRLDVLANLAGGFALAKIADSSLTELEKMLSINLRTCFLCCRKAARLMLAARRGGRIVNVSAQSARRPPGAGLACYAASKAAILGLTAALAKELSPAGITVNALLPGTIDTPANRRARPEADFSRWTSPADIAEVVVWLASDAAKAVTGAEIPV